MDAILDALSKVADLPRPVWAVVAGTLMTFGLTQKLKFSVPRFWPKEAREVSVQAIAFAIGFASTYFIWGTSDTDALIAAGLVGLWSPAAWNVLMLVIGWWKPDLRKTLSQNQRLTDE